MRSVGRRRRRLPRRDIGAPHVLRPIRRDAGAIDVEERADRHHALQVLRGHLVGGQVLRIEGEERRQVGPGRVADDEQLLRIAAVFGRMRPRPGDGVRGVLDVRRVHHARRQPVVDDDADEPGPGEELADERLLLLVALAQRAAVDRDDDRGALGAGRGVDVEAILLAAYSAVGT